jgi:phosphatidylglycerophosphatase A
LKQKTIHFLATGFGSGNSPLAPGTMGTLVAIPPYLLLQRLPLALYALVIVCAFIVGVWLCEQASKPLKTHDHPSIVWDEIVGFWLTMFTIPCTWLSVLIGFLVFRWFDIQKPWPIGWVDKKIEGGFGIMLDDMLAAVYANVVLRLIYYFLNG